MPFDYLNKTGLNRVWEKSKNAFADKASTEIELNKKFVLPENGTVGQVLTKSSDGAVWDDISSGNLEVATDSEFIDYTGLEINPITSPWNMLKDISDKITSDNSSEYASTYRAYVGYIRFIDVGTYKNVPFRLLGICDDTKSDGTPTFLSFVSEYVFEPSKWPVYPYGGAVSYPSYTNLRSTIQSYLNNFPSDLQTSICTVTKKASSGNNAYTTYTDKVWPLLCQEIMNFGDGQMYQYYENIATNTGSDHSYCMKKSADSDAGASYLTTLYGYYIDEEGDQSYANNDIKCGFTLGFCI